MALIKEFQRTEISRARPHEEVACSYDIFHDQAGKPYVQFSTFGSKTRKIPGKQSQVIQLNEDAARQLIEIIRTAYPNLR